MWMFVFCNFFYDKNEGILLRGFFKPSSSMNSPTRQGQMDVPIIVKRFKSFVLSECRDQLMVIMAHGNETKHFGVYVR